MKFSLDKFVELAGRCQLIERDELDRVVGQWKASATLKQLDDAAELAAHLVGLNLLTEWQAKKLLEGRHRGFFLGKYKLLDHLGSGGMSNVYLAEHVLMQRRVAIKVLPQHRVNESSYLARFQLEARAAAALDHRNIVRAYDLDNEGKIHYLVMEYVPGRDLHALVAERGPLDYHTAADFIAQAAAGLEHAHQCGLVHRDIKPANLLVDLKGTVKILDMGLAKFVAADSVAPHDEHVLGTADYLAPEQAVNSQSVDHRADLYALGCTFYFLLTGHPPFSEGTSLERMTAHVHQAPASLLIDRPDAPQELVNLCQRMMEKSPQARPQNAIEVQNALSAWLEREAALGRTLTPVLAAHGARTPARPPGPSGASATGASGELGPASEPPRLSSPLQDTDPHMQRGTARIPRSATSPPNERVSPPPPGSEVLSNIRPREAEPAPPPLITPPASHFGAADSFDDGSAGSKLVWRDDTQGLELTSLKASRTRNKVRSTGVGPWIVVLAALIIGALLLALSAL